MMLRVSNMLDAFRAPALALVGLAALALPAIAQDDTTAAPAPVAAPAPAIDPKTVIATINGAPITEADLELAAQDYNEQLSKIPAEQRRKAVLDAVVDLHLMATAAESAGFDKSDEFQRRMALLRETALRNEFLRVKVYGAITDADIQKRYDADVAKMPPVDEVHAEHILVKTEDEAKAIITQLDGGADFGKIAQEKSIDPGSAPRGGDLGFFGKGEMVPEFDQVVFTLPVGSYTKTPVKTKYGFHVIKVTEKRKKPQPPFDQVKDQVRQQMLTETFAAAVDSLRKANKIEIIDPVLKVAPPAAPPQ